MTDGALRVRRIDGYRTEGRTDTQISEVIT